MPVLISLPYLFSVYWIKAGAVFERHFDTAADAYPAYHAAKVVLLAYLAWIIYYAGLTLERRFFRRAPLRLEGTAEKFLLRSFLGASFLIALMFVLGVLRLYYVWTALVITVPLLVRSTAELRANAGAIGERARSEWRRLRKGGPETALRAAGIALLGSGILCQLALSLAAKGLYPDLQSDAAGHYLPSYRDVIQNHGIWMNPFFFQFYFSKGAGLHFLGVLLGDLQTFQLVSFYFYGLITVLVFQGVRNLCRGEALWGLFGAAIYLSTQSSLTEGTEFQKTHLAVGALIAGAVYLSARLLAAEPKARPPWLRLQAVLAAACLLTSPISFAFIAPFLALQAAWLLFRGRRAGPSRPILLAFAGVAAVFAAMLLVNFAMSGMFEFTPPPLFFRWRNDGLLRKWIDPVTLLMQIEYNAGDFVPFDPARLLRWDLKWVVEKLINPAFISRQVFTPLLIAGTLALAWLRRRPGKTGSLAKGAALLPTVLPAGGLFLVVGILERLMYQGSFARYIAAALTPLQTMVYVLLWAGLWDAACAILRTKAPAARTALALLAMLPAGHQAYAAFNNWNYAEVMPFITGERDFAQAYASVFGSDINTCLDFRRPLPEGTRVKLMNFFPGCFGIPGVRFERPLMNDYNRDTGVILFGDAGAAEAALRKNGVDYFAVDLRVIFEFLAYAPLFERDEMRKRFSVYWAVDPLYILTWRKEGAPPIDEPWLARFAETRKRGLEHPFARIPAKVKEIYARDYAGRP